MRISKGSQEKLEAIFRANGYTIRYEKGNFKGGHCVVQAQQTIIINKFVPLEGIIATLTELLREIPMLDSLLTEEQQKLLRQIREA
jgi:hypothetical protein